MRKTTLWTAGFLLLAGAGFVLAEQPAGGAGGGQDPNKPAHPGHGHHAGHHGHPGKDSQPPGQPTTRPGGESHSDHWFRERFAPRHVLGAHGVATQGEDAELAHLIVVEVRNRPPRHGQNGQDPTTGTPPAPPTNEPRLGGMANIAGTDYVLENIKATFEGSAPANPPATNDSNAKRAAMPPMRRLVSIEADLVEKPQTQGDIRAAFAKALKGDKPIQGNVLGTLAGKIVPKTSAHFQGKEIQVPFFDGTAKLKDKGEWRVMGRVFAGGAPGTPPPPPPGGSDGGPGQDGPPPPPADSGDPQRPPDNSQGGGNGTGSTIEQGF